MSAFTDRTRMPVNVGDRIAWTTLDGTPTGHRATVVAVGGPTWPDEFGWMPPLRDDYLDNTLWVRWDHITYAGPRQASYLTATDTDRVEGVREEEGDV